MPDMPELPSSSSGKVLSGVVIPPPPAAGPTVPPQPPRPPAGPPAPAESAGTGGGWTPPPPPPPNYPPYTAAPPVPAEMHHHITLHWPEEEPTRWQRVCRAVPLRVGLLTALTSLAAATVPIPYVDYGVARIWGEALDGMDHSVHYAVANVAGFGSMLLVLSRIGRPSRIDRALDGTRIRRLTWLDMWLVWVTGIGGTWAVVWPDLVAALTGVRA